ncbi:site-specific DNA-methyltransferase [Burkholderia oklahomensis]|uniref:site-specific DNA-methyltransferase n=1 Tax=Burkholderia oklahomensis TaxID=342113 RepID=UPI0002DAFC07|nr:site-specific DNA-methyltransferase [Burkholderia oklahomensis]AOI44357.1 adenine methyltransferase [Burkholderia oklahomensis C6786]KUY61633.1 adenine methyltransferase [Burkholderia oklahomensis C6786]MBI0359666.1 site-specific DNA-methyltransferase [Burkholderia oklahomensis]MDN7674047.1 site-specific DNA-methyltransferase [Burkholderia oklahomensis]
MQLMGRKMQKLDAASPEAQSADLVSANVERLKALFPDVVTEGPDGASVNLDALAALVGAPTVADADEKYGLNWHGKRRARRLALTPSTGTLRPYPRESVDWASTRNLMIEGENLEVLKLLQKSYAGRAKLVYIDPPYNTGKDFVYPDNFTDSLRHYLELTGQTTGGKKVSSNTDASGRFHTDWLNMIYPRLKLARDLLADDGVIAVHIDEHEQHALVLVMREIFGEDNELGVAVWDKRNPKGDARGIAYQHESIVLFARDAELLFERAPLKRPKRNAQRMLDAARGAIAGASTIAEANVAYRSWVKSQTTLSGGEAMYDRISADGRVYRLVSMAWPNKKKAPDDYFVPLVHPVTGRPCPVPERGWRNPPATMQALLDKGLVEFGADETTQPQRIYFLDENMYENVPSVLPFGGSDDALLKSLEIPFDQPKPVEFAASIIGWCTDGNDLIVDFFGGSGTTAHAVMALNAADGGNRRYALVQLPEPLDADSKDQKAAADFCAARRRPLNLAELTKERLRRSAARIAAEHPGVRADLGFRVFKLDSTNVSEWDPRGDDIQQSLLAAVEHIKPSRSDEDLLYELMLKLGLDLCAPIEARTIAGKAVYVIDGAIVACFDAHIDRAATDALGAGIVELLAASAAHARDVTCVFRDSGFTDDVAKVNLSAILEQHGVKRIRSL